MKTKPVVSAVAATLKAPAIVLPTPTQLAQAERAEARAQAFIAAYMGLADAEQEAQAQEGNAWAHYVEARGYGMDNKAVRERLYAAIGDNKDAKDSASGRVKNYNARVDALLKASVALLGKDGNMAATCTVTIAGEEVSGALGAVAQKLLKAAAKGRKARTTDGATEGEGEGEGEEGDTTTRAADPQTVAVTVGLMARVGQALTMDGAEVLRAALIAACPDAILAMAAEISKARLLAHLEGEARKAADKAKADATAERMADARKANAAELAASAKPKRQRTKVLSGSDVLGLATLTPGAR